MRIAHFSDIHFGTEQPEVVEGLAARLEELSPDLIIASGDFTMAGRHGEYERARAFLERLEPPVIATPGNHDLPVYNLFARFFRPLERYRRYVELVTVSSVTVEGVALISVNSARPWDLSFDWSHGHLSSKQIDEVDRFFDSATDAAFKGLVVHHPFVLPEDLPRFRTIGNADAMLAVLAKHGVQAAFAGHLHRQFSATRELPVESGTYELRVLQVATATSSRRRDQPNAFALYTIEGGEIEVEEQIWDGARFSPRG
ncbi:MAG: metallophosphoesterase [Planctomycetota bacterium]